MTIKSAADALKASAARIARQEAANAALLEEAANAAKKKPAIELGDGKSKGDGK